MSSISSVGSSALQASSPGSNWVQDTVNANLMATADWMDPTASSAHDAVALAANAFAAAEQIRATNLNSLAVNTGMSVLSAQLTGKSVNILA
jgi:hypothetical protein